MQVDTIEKLTPPSSAQIFICENSTENPEFPGGSKALLKYLADNLKYPKDAAAAQVEGKVFTTFFITKKGRIEDIKILKGLGYGTDQEAIRLVAEMPRWEPGKIRGKPWNVKYNLPISFALQKSTPKNHP